MTILHSYGHALPSDDPLLAQMNMPAAQEHTRFNLRRANAGKLELVDATEPRRGSLQIDFQSPEMRRRIADGRKQPLARACGLHKKPDSHIVDATAGLGRDAYCLAALGATLTLHERHPVLYALLWDALQHAPVEVVQRIQLLPQDSLQHTWPDADVLYLDPMFPSTGKRAAPGLDMQYLQAMVGPDNDVQSLWEHALASSAPRLVVKRPVRGAHVRLGKPDAQFGGGRAVYEVYLRPTLMRATDH